MPLDRIQCRTTSPSLFLGQRAVAVPRKRGIVRVSSWTLLETSRYGVRNVAARVHVRKFGFVWLSKLFVSGGLRRGNGQASLATALPRRGAYQTPQVEQSLHNTYAR